MSTNVHPRFRINVLYICIVKGINNFVTLVKHNVNNFYLLHQFEPIRWVFDRTSPSAPAVDTWIIDGTSVSTELPSFFKLLCYAFNMQVVIFLCAGNVALIVQMHSEGYRVLFDYLFCFLHGLSQFL